MTELTIRPLHLRRRGHEAATLAVALLLAACGGDDGAPPVITAQPQAQTVHEGATAEFTVAGTSDAGELSVAWRVEGGAPIGGATDATYRIDPVSLADHGQRFVATLRNAVGETASDAAQLSVTERQWAAPVRPVGTGETLSSMAVAVDSLGTTHLAYTELLADNITRLNLAYKGPQLSFPGSARGFGGFQVPAGTTHQQLRLVPGTAGVVMVLWREGIADDFGNVLKAALLYDEGAGFVELGAFTGPSGNALDAEGAWIDANTFEVVYRSFDGTHWNIATRRLTLNAARNGGQWAAETAVEALDTDFGAPRIASDGQGNVLVAFSPLTAAPRTFVNARAATATAWQPAAAVDVSDVDVSTPAQLAALSMNAQGRGVMLMRSDQTRIYMRIYDFAASTPGWQTGAAYVANYWENLPGDVDPAIVFHGGGPTFSIISVHNNGRFISRWPCGSSSCGAPQTFVDAGDTDTVVDLRVARDAAGNVIVGYSRMLPDQTMWPYAVRYHQGLGTWRAAAAIGTEAVDGRLALAMAADGRATLLFATPTPGLAPRTADFR